PDIGRSATWRRSCSSTSGSPPIEAGYPRPSGAHPTYLLLRTRALRAGRRRPARRRVPARARRSPAGRGRAGGARGCAGRKHAGSFADAYLKLPFRWQVSFFSRGGKKEIGQVIIDDASGRVLEQWTGFQVAWTMARGYPGAFGRHVNALYVWLPLCALFLLPFINFRRPFSLLHLDLLVLLSFSISLA